MHGHGNGDGDGPGTGTTGDGNGRRLRVMDDPELRQRVEQLEQEVARLRGGGVASFRGVRYRSSAAIGDLPLLAVSIGPDAERGEMRGRARGVFAIGDIATGVVALGGLARGLVAIGGLAVGALSFGGLSLGVLAAVGGVAIGSLAVGGAAAGGVAMGGGAIGQYACGGAAAGAHTVSALGRDPEAERFFQEYGLTPLCGR